MVQRAFYFSSVTFTRTGAHECGAEILGGGAFLVSVHPQSYKAYVAIVLILLLPVDCDRIPSLIVYKSRFIR